MKQTISQLDAILRGDATRPELLREGQLRVPIVGLAGVLVALGAFYGLCMGSYGVFRIDPESGRTAYDAYMQLVASALKTPLLFFFTLIITFPSLYVFNALVGSRLSLVSVLRLLVASLAVMLAVLASLGPIVVFFSVSTDSYPFMKLLNVAAGTLAGLFGLAFLLRTLQRLLGPDLLHVATPPTHAPEPILQAAEQEADDADPDDDAHAADAPPRRVTPPTTPRYSGPLERVEGLSSRKARRVFQIWTLVFGLVGAQMSWIMRPFLGSPGMPFTWFRDRQSNFFLEVLKALRALMGAD